jgi:FkbM family methyltransferase
MKAILKKIFLSKRFLYALKWRFKYYKRRTFESVEIFSEYIIRLSEGKPHPWKLNILDAYAKSAGSIMFIQIGSNNGKNGDPLYYYINNFKWRGVLVEPVPYLYEELKNNYDNSRERLHFENSAVANVGENLKFWRLRKSDSPILPDWYDQLGSFKKEVISKHRYEIPGFDDLLIEDAINSISFDELLDKYKIQELNLVHIDTEGFDYEILKMIPFKNVNIDLLIFEHKHLSDEDYKLASKLLEINGFRIGTMNDADTLAIQKKKLKKLVKG